MFSNPYFHAVFVPFIVWFSFRPECEFPGIAGCGPLPLPGALLFNVIASNPEIAYAFSFHFLPEKDAGGFGGGRGQVSTLLHAEVFSVIPVLLVSAPEVAVFLSLLPAFFAGFHAIASRT